MKKKKPVSEEYEWLTTAPDPRHPGTGHDAGQRGWRTHAVKVGGNKRITFAELASKRALCGLRPSHGWGMDLYIEERCSRCDRRIDALMVASYF